MLKIIVTKKELFNEATSEFIDIPETTLSLEHSLVSISKWESKHCKSFFSREPKTDDETLDYVKCMTVNTNVPDKVYLGLSAKNLSDIKNYLDSPMTATTVRETGRPGGGRELLTSELIYYYMIALGIPFECQKWHINRLLMLIKVCNAKNGGQKKMTKAEQMAQYRSLNQARRAALHTKG